MFAWFLCAFRGRRVAKLSAREISLIKNAEKRLLISIASLAESLPPCTFMILSSGYSPYIQLHFLCASRTLTQLFFFPLSSYFSFFQSFFLMFLSFRGSLFRKKNSSVIVFVLCSEQLRKFKPNEYVYVYKSCCVVLSNDEIDF